MMKRLLAIAALGSLVTVGSACSVVETKSPGPDPSSKRSTSPEGTSPKDPSTDEDETSPAPNGGGGVCAEPTAVYDETRTVTAVVEPPGPDSPCDVGSYQDDVDFSQPPAKNELPGCVKTRDEWSADGCTHIVIRQCETNQETCSQTITFASDLSTYSGTMTCKGFFEGIDDSGPYTCKTTIEAKRIR